MSGYDLGDRDEGAGGWGLGDTGLSVLKVPSKINERAQLRMRHKDIPVTARRCDKRSGARVRCYDFVLPMRLEVLCC